MMLSVRVFLVIAIAIFSNTALGAPYSTTYTSTTDTGRNPHPDIAEVESYTVTLVMDNGGASAASQEWTPADLQCVIFEFNDARNVVFAQDLVADGNFVADGNAVTDSSGVFEDFFNRIVDDGTSGDATNYASRGFTDLRDPVYWFLNNANAVWYDDEYGRRAGDIDGGVQMNPGEWSAPTAYSGTCDATAVPGAPTIGTVTAGNTQATVTWAAPADNGGSAIISYTATAVEDDTKSCTTPDGSTLTCDVTGLTNGTPYTFTVTATNAVGTSAASSTSNSVTPVAPATPVPSMPLFGLLTLGGLVGLFGLRKLKK